MKKMRWGLSVLVMAGATSFSFEASSQQALNPGLIGGGVQDNSTFNPLNQSMVPRAFILAQDPFAGADFAMCEMKAAQEDTARASADLIRNPNLGKTTADALGGALGALAANGSVGAGVQQSFSGEACLDQSITANESPPLECEAYKSGDKFEESLIKDEMAEQENALSASSCKARASKRASELTSCFAKEHEKLLKAMQEVKKDFDQNIQNMEKYVSDVEAAVQKEGQKEEELSGKQKTFSERFAQVDAFISKLNSQSSGDVKTGDGTASGIQRSIDRHRERLKAHEENRKAQSASRSASCMRGGGASTSQLRVCPNASADLLAPKDCILSIHKDSILRELSGGGNRFSNADRKKADVQTKIFAQRLEQMLNDLQIGRVHDDKSFKAKFGAELANIGPAGSQMLVEIGNCADETEKDMQEELKNPASPLGQNLAQLSDEAQSISSGLGSVLGELNTHMRDASRDLFGKELGGNFNAGGCSQSFVSSNAPRNADGSAAAAGQVAFQQVGLQKQMDCVRNLTASLTSLRDGTPQPGQSVEMQFPLNVLDEKGQPIRCSGLRTCAERAGAEAGKVKRKIENMTGDGTFEDARCPGGCPGLRAFRKQANQQIRTAMQTAADLFAARVSVMTAQFGRLKGLLGKIGVEDLEADAERTDLEEICPVNAEKICKPSKDFDKVLAGMSGVPKLDAETFKEGRKNARKIQEENEKLARTFSKNVDKLRMAIATCKKKLEGEKLDKKLASFERKMNSRLAKCKNGTAGIEVKGHDFGSNFAGLSDELERVCGESTGDKCSELSTRSTELVSECMAFANQQQGNKPTIIVQGPGAGAPTGSAVGGQKDPP